jgi:hypothetical protein
MIRCERCNGTGIVKGLGMIEHKCLECKGTGWLLEDDEKLPSKGETQQSIVLSDLDKILEKEEVAVPSRIHEDDLPGSIVNTTEFNHLKIPAEVSKSRSEKMKASWAKRKAAQQK